MCQIIGICSQAYKNDIRLYRLEKKDKSIKAVQYDHDILQASLESEWEVALMDEIKARKVIAVEGKDEVRFIESLLRYMNIDVSKIQIVDVAGKNNFKKKLPALVRMTGFSEVEIFAVVRDADDDSESAFKSIKHVWIKKI